MRSKSSIVSSTPASFASASRCRTAFVEPPVAATQATAFSMDSRVMTRLGLRSSSSRRITSLPQSSAAWPFFPSSAGTIEVPIAEMPSISKAVDIVLAVNWPPHAPAPGEATDSSSARSASLMSPAAWAPTASKTSWIVTSWPW